jgi:hypothetical protein
MGRTYMRRVESLRRKVLVAVTIGGVVLAATPSASLAASYPVQNVQTNRYALAMTADQNTVNLLTTAGCTVLGLVTRGAIGFGCAIGTSNLTLKGGVQLGWWKDEIWQTSQAFVHIGASCDMNGNNCMIIKWDIYAKTGSSYYDGGCYALLNNYGPLFYGYGAIGACPRWPNESLAEVIQVINGYGL